MVVATQATVVVVVSTVVHRVSLMAIALRVLTVTLLPVLMRIHVPKRHHALKLRQARSQVALSNPHVHLMVATTAATAMIAPHVLAVTPAMVATLVAVKTVVQRLLIVVVRTRAFPLRAPSRQHAPTRVAKSAARSVLTAHTLVLLPVLATAMIARRVLLVTVIHVRSLIAHRVLIQIAAIVSNALSARQRRAANTLHVHAPSVRSHSSAQNALNTRRAQRVRSSMKLARRVTPSALRVLLRRLPPMAAIARLAVPPSRLSMLRQ